MKEVYMSKRFLILVISFFFIPGFRFIDAMNVASDVASRIVIQRTAIQAVVQAFTMEENRYTNRYVVDRSGDDSISVWRVRSMSPVSDQQVRENVISLIRQFAQYMFAICDDYASLPLMLDVTRVSGFRNTVNFTLNFPEQNLPPESDAQQPLDDSSQDGSDGNNDTSNNAPGEDEIVYNSVSEDED